MPDLRANTDGSVTVTETDLLGKELTYRVRPEDTFAYLVDIGVKELPDLVLPSTDTDLDELLAIRDEFTTLLEDVFAEDRTERLLILRQRFLDWRTAQKIAEAEPDTHTDTEGTP